MDITDVCFAGAAAQADLLRAKELSAGELVAECLRRIERYDRRLNAFRLVFDEQATADAAEADRRLAAGDDAPLLGVPVAVKEDLPMAGYPTTKGTDGITTPVNADSEIVRRLRGTGAVIIGQTRAPELCLMPFTESTFAGATRNPWSYEHSAGGSSGGSAAAVAAGLAGAALGSDGGGSIRIPSACAGLFGLKPQTGRISNAPAREVWYGYSTPGPLTRTVRDWAVLADLLRGRLPDEPALPNPRTSFTAAASAEPERLRIAFSLRPWGLGVRVSDEVRRAVTDTVTLLESLGHDVWEEDPELIDPTLVFTYAPRYFRSAADWRAELERPDLVERRTKQIATIGRLFGDKVLARSRRFGQRVAERANRVFERADLLITPVMPRTAQRVGECQGWTLPHLILSIPALVSFTALWNVAGNPAAAVPAGFGAGGLPLSVQVVGRPNDECTVLSLAAQLERARPWAQAIPELST